MCGDEGDYGGERGASGTCGHRHRRWASSPAKDPGEISLDCVGDTVFMLVYTHDFTVIEERHISPVPSGNSIFEWRFGEVNQSYCSLALISPCLK